MKKLSIYILLIFISSFSVAQNKMLIDSANYYYSNQNFIKSAELYEQVISQGYVSTETYYNLGNAYYKQGKLADAILFYERAILLSPSDEDIKYNLELAHSNLYDKIEALPEFFLNTWYKSFRNLYNSDNWIIISVISFILFLILILLYLFSNKLIIRKLTFWFGIILILISIISFLFSYQQKELVTSHNTAIIFNPSVTIKSTPKLL